MTALPPTALHFGDAWVFRKQTEEGKALDKAPLVITHGSHTGQSIQLTMSLNELWGQGDTFLAAPLSEVDSPLTMTINGTDHHHKGVAVTNPQEETEGL